MFPHSYDDPHKHAHIHIYIYPNTLLCLLVEMKPATLVWLSNDGGMFGRETSKRFAVQFF